MFLDILKSILNIFGYPGLKKAGETSAFFGCIYRVIRALAVLLVIAVIILIIALALKNR